jgi:hypothetical protein
MVESMGTAAGVARDINKVTEQLKNVNNSLDDTLRGLVDAGSFAWFSYGMLCMTNVIYYTDKFYWYFIIRDDVNILAFRTWWGVSEFSRVVGNYALWSIALLFWGLTFIPAPEMHQLFAAIATFVLWFDMIRLFGILILKCLAFVMDDYSKQYKYYPYKIEWGGETTSLSIDFSLELSTFIGQLIAYPLLQHSVKQLGRYRAGEMIFNGEEKAPLQDAPAEIEDIF